MAQRLSSASNRISTAPPGAGSDVQPSPVHEWMVRVPRTGLSSTWCRPAASAAASPMLYSAASRFALVTGGQS